MAKTLAILAGLAAAVLALPAQARPYLMLNADDHGFQALDLGGIDRSRQGLAQATLIEAPLAGIMTGGKLAALVARRVEIDCAGSRWRVLSTAWLDGKEQTLGQDPAAHDWTAFGQDDAAPAAQAAACRREFSQALVSRYLNLGEIVTNYQAAHAKAAPQPMTDKEIRDHKFRNGH
ncbi:MAG: hypothetical protein ACXU82_15770 [Caulobacteraceae bacterium]